MELQEYEIMFGVEGHHWWYQGLQRSTRAILDRWIGRGGGLRILDAGCGTGGTLTYLADYGTAAGIDMHPAALGFCTKRGLERLARASVLELPFASASFDLITSFDVLSECGAPADEQGLEELARVLAPRGWLLLRLPAYEWLGGTRHDQAVMTRHRFTRRELARKLEAAGLDLVHASYANTALFPLALAKRLLDRLTPGRQQHSDTALSMGPLNALFRAILKAEAPLVRSVGLPFGLTLIALARKR